MIFEALLVLCECCIAVMCSVSYAIRKETFAFFFFEHAQEIVYSCVEVVWLAKYTVNIVYHYTIEVEGCIKFKILS